MKTMNKLNDHKTWIGWTEHVHPSIFWELCDCYLQGKIQLPTESEEGLSMQNVILTHISTQLEYMIFLWLSSLMCCKIWLIGLVARGVHYTKHVRVYVSAQKGY